MIPLELWYSKDHDQVHGVRVASPGELDAALDRLAALSRADWPTLATVSPWGAPRSGPLLYAGFHVDRGTLMYSGDDDPDGSLSVDPGSRASEPILYMYYTSDNEVPPNAEVSADQVRRAVHEFAATGTRPTCVDWQPWRAGDDPAEAESAWPDRD